MAPRSWTPGHAHEHILSHSGAVAHLVSTPLQHPHLGRLVGGHTHPGPSPDPARVSPGGGDRWDALGSQRPGAGPGRKGGGGAGGRASGAPGETESQPGAGSSEEPRRAQREGAAAQQAGVRVPRGWGGHEPSGPERVRGGWERPGPGLSLRRPRPLCRVSVRPSIRLSAAPPLSWPRPSGQPGCWGSVGVGGRPGWPGQGRGCGAAALEPRPGPPWTCPAAPRCSPARQPWIAGREGRHRPPPPQAPRPAPRARGSQLVTPRAGAWHPEVPKRLCGHRAEPWGGGLGVPASLRECPAGQRLGEAVGLERAQP